MSLGTATCWWLENSGRGVRGEGPEAGHRLTYNQAPMKIRFLAPVLLLLLPSAAVSAPIDRAGLAARVRAEFLHSWRAYERYAWGHDELKPLSKAPHDWYGESLLMTPVDSLSSETPTNTSAGAEMAGGLA